MIKHAEVQNAYLQGRQAAMIKLANDPRYSTVAPPEEQLAMLAALDATRRGEDVAEMERQGIGIMSNEVPSLMSEAKPEPGFWSRFAMKDMAAKSKSPSVEDTVAPNTVAPSTSTPTPSPQELSMYQRALAGLRAAGANQMGVLGDIGLTGQGLYDRNLEQSAYDPRQLATRENLSRLGMLAGAGGGAYLGGMDPRAAAIASAGALGGGFVGGNLGQGINAALGQFGYGGDRGTATSIGGALGGLGGGLGAGYLA